MLELEGITRAFLSADGTMRHVLKGVSMSVRNGEITCLMGGNGSGKSTILNIVAGSVIADGGSVILDGSNISQMAAHRRARVIGRVQQDSYKSVAGDLEVREILAIANSRRKRLRLASVSATAAIGTVARLSPEVGDFLQHVSNYASKELSGGQRQLLSIAVSVLGEPRLLLLDEHLASLDAEHRDGVDRLLREFVLGTGAAALVVTHDPLWAAAQAAAVWKLSNGEVMRT